LYHYPTPTEIVNLGIDKLELIVRKLSCNRFGGKIAEQLYEAAKQTVGIGEGQTSIVKEIKNLLQGINQQQRFITECESDITESLSNISWSKYLLSIKGIGEITVAAVIGELAAFKDFKTGSAVEKYVGLNLFEISSGKHQGQKHISKRGRPLLRKMLYFASLNAVRKDGIFHDKYQSYLDRGMPKPKALVAILRKLLRMMYAIGRDHKEFDIGYLTRNKLEAA
jgi:hypothetical protein